MDPINGLRSSEGNGADNYVVPAHLAADQI